MKLKVIEGTFAVCKLADLSNADLSRPFCFLSRTDEEISLVCPSELAPKNALKTEDGWRAFRIEGELDFSLIGILSRITGILAERKIGLFAISTYNTDYVLTRADRFEEALSALGEAGYDVG